MTTATSSAPFTTVDVRSIAPRERHPLIFSTFPALRAGQSGRLACRGWLLRIVRRLNPTRSPQP